MLFKGDDTRIVKSLDEKAQALADGWEVRLLPGETADEYPASPPKKSRKSAE